VATRISPGVLKRIRAETALGDHSLQAAERMSEAGLPKVLARAYVAATHYAQALMLLHAFETKALRSIVSFLDERYVAPGLLPRDCVQALSRLDKYRSEEDHGGRPLDTGLVQAELDEARRFVAHCRRILRDLGAIKY
jgi:uncharacterized protein (UPF0332 family)